MQAALERLRTALPIDRAAIVITQSGQKLRLREKGVPSATREGARGDEIVEISFFIFPPILKPEQVSKQLNLDKL